jgi:hypothetical protein
VWPDYDLRKPRIEKEQKYSAVNLAGGGAGSQSGAVAQRKMVCHDRGIERVGEDAERIRTLDHRVHGGTQGKPQTECAC